MLTKKIEAREACDWLRAAGFPQYVQLFRDCRFPVDIEWVKRDHPFLDQDALDSLCRRLITLNKCSEMKLELSRMKRRRNVYQEEDFCTISPNWTYDRHARQWRRLGSSSNVSVLSGSPAHSLDESSCDVIDLQDVCSIRSSSSSESDGHDGRRLRLAGTTPVTISTPASGDTSRSSSRCSSAYKTASLDTSFSGPPSPSTASLEADGCLQEKPPRRTGTTLLRRMEKLRLRGAAGLLSPEQSCRPTVGARPVLIQDKFCRSSPQTPPTSRLSSSPSSPRTISSSSSHSESSSAVSTPSPVTRVRSNCKRSSSSAGIGSSRNHQTQSGSEDYRNRVNGGRRQVFHLPKGHKPGTFPTALADKHPALSAITDSNSVNWRTGSFHGYRNRHAAWSLADQGHAPSGVPERLPVLDNRLSVYDNVPDDPHLSESEGGSDAERTSEESEVSQLLAGEDVFSALDSVLERISDLQQLVSLWSEDVCRESSRTGSSHDSSTRSCPSSPSHIHLEVQRPEEAESSRKIPEEPKTRSWRSSRMSQQQRRSSQQNLPPLPPSPGLEVLTVSQVVQLQKLALLKLTALMDKHSPSSRQGWSWTVPKPPSTSRPGGLKVPRVFGAPLLLSLRQTGEALPPCISRALLYLRSDCLDQVGLFRKSGVKSRIQLLREQVESDPEGVSFEGQSAFDVADLVKQFFRDLPEPVFSSRLCESFLHIYQYVPQDQQLLATQAAVLLLPDENREALQTLLHFLWDVVSCVDQNQMTPTNIAVCLAPSLFHLTAKKDSRSGHRKHSLGRPDQRDLSENLAATQGLAFMITEVQRLFQVPEFWPGQGVGPEESRGGEEEREEQMTRLKRSTQRLLEELREENPVWENQPGPEPLDLAFRKGWGDAPLRLWRGSVEVDAPHRDVLRRLLREQLLWEPRLLQAAVIQTLSDHADIYRFLLRGRSPLPPQEHLLLRTWQDDPLCGPLYLSSASTEHPEIQPGGVRVHVHTCLYLLEPTGAIKTRLTHLCQTDFR
ncbi:Rho GTPase-activating protein 7 [Oryzias melastigma]|uniref:Rho GTPase-activating protein 7 n=1 Tax=Oryzias melastigma TaxID=30732 RepID=A0A834L2M1_ORYME|nr:Rho GTPase-activating protein 7 [Oryzias melastigma]